jgi:hypothetical protein
MNKSTEDDGKLGQRICVDTIGKVIIALLVTNAFLLRIPCGNSLEEEDRGHRK